MKKMELIDGFFWEVDDLFSLIEDEEATEWIGDIEHLFDVPADGIDAKSLPEKIEYARKLEAWIRNWSEFLHDEMGVNDVALLTLFDYDWMNG